MSLVENRISERTIHETTRTNTKCVRARLVFFRGSFWFSVSTPWHEIVYLFKGVVQKYRPDFIIHLANGEHLILETKGQESERDKGKRSFLAEWVRAINEHGGFGQWRAAVSRHPDDVLELFAIPSV